MFAARANAGSKMEAGLADGDEVVARANVLIARDASVVSRDVDVKLTRSFVQAIRDSDPRCGAMSDDEIVEHTLLMQAQEFSAASRRKKMRGVWAYVIDVNGRQPQRMDWEVK